jgi:hypothetical protein
MAAVSALGVRSQKLSNISPSWVTKSLLSRAPPCFGRHVKPLVPAVFVFVSAHSNFNESWCQAGGQS